MSYHKSQRLIKGRSLTSEEMLHEYPKDHIDDEVNRKKFLLSETN